MLKLKDKDVKLQATPSAQLHKASRKPYKLGPKVTKRKSLKEAS